MDNQTIMLCAGGTGGHMFPALALAHDLRSRGCRVVIVTDKRAEKFAKGDEQFEVRVISSSALSTGLWGKLSGMALLAWGYIQSVKLISTYKPSLMVGFGGYPSLPPMIAAQRHNVLTVIHEQNAVLGRANAYLASKADRIALSLPELSSLDEVDAVRAVVTGNPVRTGIAELYTVPYKTPGDDGSFFVTVFGGSLGAKVMADYVPEALSLLPEDLRRRIIVTQQCREDDTAGVQAIYEQAGINAILQPFFNNVPELLKNSHLIIARSGASTVAEVSIAGIPAIYIPYPYHADQQQKVNADVVARQGGAWVMEEATLTAQRLSDKIAVLMRDPKILFTAAEAARNCAKPEAARKLGNLCIALLKGWDKNESKPFDYTQGRSENF